MIYAFGIDGGVTTGWAAIGVSRASIFDNEPGGIQEWESGQIDGPFSGQVIALASIIKRFSPVAIITEGFDPKADNRTEAFWSPIIVNSMLIFANHLGMTGPMTTMHEQMPGLAKSTATDPRLRKWGLYAKGSRHARDGTRHAITFIRRAKQNPTLAREAWPI
jgi:hypothetical protein